MHQAGKWTFLYHGFVWDFFKADSGDVSSGSQVCSLGRFLGGERRCTGGQPVARLSQAVGVGSSPGLEHKGLLPWLWQHIWLPALMRLKTKGYQVFQNLAIAALGVLESVVGWILSVFVLERSTVRCFIWDVGISMDSSVSKSWYLWKASFFIFCWSVGVWAACCWWNWCHLWQKLSQSK